MRSREITVGLRRRPRPEAIQIFHCESLPQRSLKVRQRGHGDRPVAPQDLAAPSWQIKAITQDVSRVKPLPSR
jgi:hypothetical protein